MPNGANHFELTRDGDEYVDQIGNRYRFDQMNGEYVPLANGEEDR